MEKGLEAEGGGNMITKQLEGLEWEVVVAIDPLLVTLELGRL